VKAKPHIKIDKSKKKPEETVAAISNNLEMEEKK